MISRKRAAKNRLTVLVLFLLLSAIGVVSCSSGLSLGSRTPVDAPRKSPLKKVFSKAAVTAAVSSIDDVNMAADADSLILAWLTRSQSDSDVLTVAGFDGGGRRQYRIDVAEMSGMHSIQASLVDPGRAVVTWRARTERALEAPGAPNWKGTDNLYMALVDSSGSSEPMVLDPAVSDFGWRGPEGGWTKIVNKSNGSFAVYWYNSNDFELQRELLVPKRLGPGADKETDAMVARGKGWVVRQGDPVVRMASFTAAGQPHGETIDTLVGDQEGGGDASETAKVVEGLDVDEIGFVYAVSQMPTGPGKRIKGEAGAKPIIRIPVEVRFSKFAQDRRLIPGRPIADSAIYDIDGSRPRAAMFAGDGGVVNIVWPTSNKSGTSYKLSQFSREGMQMGPDAEIEPDDEPGLAAAIEDKMAFAKSDGADLAVGFFALGSRLFDFKIPGAQQGRISASGSDLLAVWIGTGADGEELQAGRWRVQD